MSRGPAACTRAESWPGLITISFCARQREIHKGSTRRVSRWAGRPTRQEAHKTAEPERPKEARPRRSARVEFLFSFNPF